MRKITFGGASSLDNYLARKDDAVDWLLWSDEGAAVMADYWKTIDTILMGRKTYEVGRRMSKGRTGSPGLTTYVFSRTLQPDSDENVTIVAEDAATFVRQLTGTLLRGLCLFLPGGFLIGLAVHLSLLCRFKQKVGLI